MRLICIVHGHKPVVSPGLGVIECERCAKVLATPDNNPLLHALEERNRKIKEKRMTKRTVETGKVHHHPSKFDMGDMVKEKLSGVKGRVVGISFWETGCNHIGIKRLGVDKDGKPFDILWFDEPMVDLLPEKDESTAPNQSTKPGGPLPTGFRYG